MAEELPDDRDNDVGIEDAGLGTLFRQFLDRLYDMIS